MTSIRPTHSWPVLLATAFLAGCIVTSVVFAPFAMAPQGCEGLGCMGVLLYWPIAAVVSLIAAVAVGSWAGRGGHGYLAAIIAAGAGFFATNAAIAQLRLFPG